MTDHPVILWEKLDLPCGTRKSKLRMELENISGLIATSILCITSVRGGALPSPEFTWFQ